MSNRNYILSEGVLNDNTLILPPNGYVFKGGYVAIVKEYRFQNAWSNSEHIKRFRNEERLLSYLRKNYDSEVVEEIEL